MIIRSKADKKLPTPIFFLSGMVLNICNEAKYLEHNITDDLSDDRDIYRQYRMVYAQSNMLIRKFGMCSSYVKVALFKAFCTPMYTAHLWWRYKNSSIKKTPCGI